MTATIHQHRGTLLPLLRLVWPVLIEQLLVMLVGFSDTLLAGHYLSPAHLAAMTGISYALWLLTNLFAIVSIGAVAMTARFIGAQDPEMANRVVNQSLVLGGFLALVLTTLGWFGADYYAAGLQLTGEPAELTTRFLRIIVCMLPMIMLEAVSIGCLRGAGDMLIGLGSMVLVNVVNIGLSWALVSGAGPFPELGWEGLAIGTACGHALGGLVPFTVLCLGRRGLRVRWSLLRPDFDLMRRILRIGLPGGLDVLSIVGLQLVFLSIVNHLPTVDVAAHGVAIRIESLAYLPGYAFQVAAATLCGQYLGAKDPRQAARSVITACLTSGGMLTIAGLIMFLKADALVDLFLGPDQRDVALVAPTLLRIVSVAMPFLALMQVFTGALRGAGDTAWPLAITLVGFVGVRLPLAYVLVIWQQVGIQGAWYAMVADVLFRTGLITTRFLHGGWKRVGSVRRRG